MVDFFVSYAGPDRPWAEWVAWQLEGAGCSVELDVWDWSAGDNFVVRMNDALAADRLVALYSPAYFASDRFTMDEWTAAVAAGGRLVPLRVAEVDPPPILAPLVYRDLFGLDETAARAALLAAVGVGGGRPVVAPVFPAGPGQARPEQAGPLLPGTTPTVWNVRARNPAFTGREALLAALRQRLCGGDRAWVQALRGIGGVGKTQLAVEYAHLFAGDYDLVWWVDAERAELVGEQLAVLAVWAGWVGEGAAVQVAADTALGRLRRMPRWLVVFDNVESVGQVRPWLPQGGGHVVITSRRSGFAGVAVPVEVDVFSRSESVGLLRGEVPGLSERDADRLAQALGDLPLALAQAVGLLGETGMTGEEYLAELAEHAGELLAEGAPVDYPVPLAAAVELSVQRLGGEDPAAVQLLQVAAMLAPEPIPLAWWTTAADGLLPEPLAGAVSSRLGLRRMLGRLAGYGLAQVTGDTLLLHRLTQAVLRDRRSDDQRAEDRQRAQHLVHAAEPEDDGTDPTSWPAWAELLPHLLAVDPTTAGADLRWTACNALWYLLMRAEYHTAVTLADAWRLRWLEALGPDDHHVLSVTSQLATGHSLLGQPERSRPLMEDVLARRRRVLGEDHPDTLSSANILVIDLRQAGEHQRARQLNEDVYTRRRRILGDDHPDTLSSANNLAIGLRQAGEHERARQLAEDTYTRYRRVLGDDHPDTLRSASNLAIDLTNLGEHQRARQLDEDTYTRYRRVLGDDHPDTLRSAHNLAIDLTNLGEHELARQLDEDTYTRRPAPGIDKGASEDGPATEGVTSPHGPSIMDGDVCARQAPAVPPVDT